MSASSRVSSGGRREAWSLLVSAALLASGCSPVVGAACRGDLAQCGAECVDLDRDSRHCGACGDACEGAEACVHGACVGYGADAEVGDAGAGVADASWIDRDAAWVDRDAGAPDATNGRLDASLDGGPLGCDLGELRCGSTCVRPGSDPRHCGGCGIECAAGEVCAGGACAGACAAPRATCDGRCVDLRRDPDHCGACGVSCESGVCAEGECASRVAGHLVLVGHDYEESRPGMNRVAGNAVFLGRGSPVRILAFEGEASEASIAGTDAAIAQVAAATGRSVTRTVAERPDEVSAQLADADVLVLYAQAGATDEELAAWGGAWSRALHTFLGTGGVVVVFDGLGANGGTHRALVAANLLFARGRADASGRVLTVTSPADAVVLGVPLRYRGERSTVRFDATDEGMVVGDGVGPVVLHRTVAP